MTTVTAAEIARVRIRKAVGQMVEYRRVRQDRTQAKMEAKDGTQGGALATVGSATGKGND